MKAENIGGNRHFNLVDADQIRYGLANHGCCQIKKERNQKVKTLSVIDFSNILGILPLGLVPHAAPCVYAGLAAQGFSPEFLIDPGTREYWEANLDQEEAVAAFDLGLQATATTESVRDVDQVLLQTLGAVPGGWGLSNDKFRDHRGKFPSSVFDRVRDFTLTQIPNEDDYLLHITGVQKAIRLVHFDRESWEMGGSELAYEIAYPTVQATIQVLDAEEFSIAWEPAPQCEADLACIGMAHVQRALDEIREVATVTLLDESSAIIKVPGGGLDTDVAHTLIESIRLHGGSVKVEHDGNGDEI